MTDLSKAFATFRDITYFLGLNGTEALVKYGSSTLPFPRTSVSMGTMFNEQEAANVLVHLGYNVSEMLPALKKHMEEQSTVSLDVVNAVMRDLKHIRVLVNDLQSGNNGFIPSKKYREYATGIMKLLGVEDEKIVPIANVIAKHWICENAKDAAKAVGAFDEDLDDDKDFF